MLEPAETFERDGVTVEIVPDDDPVSDPQDNDNAGTIYSWTREWDGDKSIYQPDTVSGRPYELADDLYEITDRDAATRILRRYFAEIYEAALVIPLRFEDYGSSGARLYITDASSANAVITFTAEEIEKEWGSRRGGAGTKRARAYAEARVGELDDWFQGNAFGIVTKDSDGEVVESVWGYIGDLYGKSGEYIIEEAKSQLDYAVKADQHEKSERAEWAARDVVTV